MKFVVTLALTLTLSPGERGQPDTISVLPVDCPANPAAGFSKDAGNVKALSVGRGFG